MVATTVRNPVTGCLGVVGVVSPGGPGRWRPGQSAPRAVIPARTTVGPHARAALVATATAVAMSRVGVMSIASWKGAGRSAGSVEGVEADPREDCGRAPREDRGGRNRDRGGDESCRCHVDCLRMVGGRSGGSVEAVERDPRQDGGRTPGEDGRGRGGDRGNGETTGGFQGGASVLGSGQPSFGTSAHRGSRRCAGSVDAGDRDTGEDRGRAPQDSGGGGSNHGTDDETTR